MVKKEVLELKKRFTKDNHNFDRISGCYVNGEKEKIATFSKSFLNLDEDIMPRYLDIAKKCLSGKLGNNLIELEFPLEEEKVGGVQHSLLALRDSKLNNDDLLNSYYDHIIDTYEYVGNYLILLLHGVYDVPGKGSDGADMGESEVVYEYILGAICPVELGKDTLGYLAEDTTIGLVKGQWSVKAPETAFLFPTFTDRSSDIHATLMYTKNTMEPHTEFMKSIMACEEVETEDIVRDTFDTMVKQAVKLNCANEEEVEDTLLMVHQELWNELESHNATYKGTTDEDILKIDEDMLEKVLENVGIDSDVIATITTDFKKSYKDKDIYVSKLVDEKKLNKEALKIENKMLKEKIKVLTEKLNHQS